MINHIKLWYWWTFILGGNIYNLYEYWENKASTNLFSTKAKALQEDIVLLLASGVSPFSIEASLIKDAEI